MFNIISEAEYIETKATNTVASCCVPIMFEVEYACDGGYGNMHNQLMRAKRATKVEGKRQEQHSRKNRDLCLMSAIGKVYNRLVIERGWEFVKCK